MQAAKYLVGAEATALLRSGAENVAGHALRLRKGSRKVLQEFGTLSDRCWNPRKAVDGVLSFAVNFAPAISPSGIDA